jgi:hypothetical protein
MADINVERKGASIWPWILGLLVAALLIWALAGLFGDDEEEVETTDPAVEVGALLLAPAGMNAEGAPTTGAPWKLTGQPTA